MTPLIPLFPFIWHIVVAKAKVIELFSIDHSKTKSSLSKQIFFSVFWYLFKFEIQNYTVSFLRFLYFILFSYFFNFRKVVSKSYKISKRNLLPTPAKFNHHLHVLSQESGALRCSVKMRSGTGIES